MWKKIRPYLVSILIALAVGGLAGFIIKDSVGLYSSLKKPLLAPPASVFPIVWSILYVLMGISAAMVYRSGSLFRRCALMAYGAQLAANFLWPIFFFLLQWRLFAFFWLILLVSLVIIMTDRFSRISPVSGWLQLPHFFWLLFAGYLNLYVWYMNK